MVRATISVTGLDHIVLNCADIDITLQWYVDRLGLIPLRVDEWRNGSAPFPSARINDTTIIDFITGDTHPGRLDHFCLVVETTDLRTIAASGDFEVLDGPATRFGARGNGESLYVRDPNGTVVELRHYPNATDRSQSGA